MAFPFFQVPYLGNGMTIALNAVLHVFLSHGIAIGLIALIVHAEWRGWRTGNAEWERYARTMIVPAVVIITAVGAVTGAGIWFIVSALAPRGLGSMLRLFFWPWFIEWMVFTLEVIVILFYYYTWKSWTGSRKGWHVLLGALYTPLGILSAVLITGILGFMLTSDGWPWSGSFWQAFLNPTFAPQLLLRIAICFGIGSLVALLFIAFGRWSASFRREAGRFHAAVLLTSLLGGLLAAFWYFGAVPRTFGVFAVFSVLTSHLIEYETLFWAINGVAVLVIAIAALAARGRRRWTLRIAAPLALLFMLSLVTEFERVREFIRGPYLMPGYMYANEVLLAEVPLMQQRSAVQGSWWYQASPAVGTVDEQGAHLFAQNCGVCHTIGGLNDITDRLKGRSRDGIYVLAGYTSRMVPFMAPFGGTDAERRIMADYLYRLTAGETEVVAPSRFLPTIGEDTR